MSRVAKRPITVPKGVDCVVDVGSISVKGPKGSLQAVVPSSVSVKLENGVITLAPTGESSAMAGTMRALIANMVEGVTVGYQRKLELVGVGYRATMAGKDLNLTLGFSHPVLFKAPAGVTLEAPTQTEVLIKGADKQQVGQAAAKIRAFRSPEPYKGKGVRYAGEKITLKEAKKA
ncbi:MAG: 50S ribosomal protein L6 [Lysobacterales bacterium CG02_land_8_20_14_3_00_62_12]|nr:MAG: 50S ribosomal protein L6 [Xanthomonadales bacterium CG02_land_8_20_14_3_00_62_12]